MTIVFNFFSSIAPCCRTKRHQLKKKKHQNLLFFLIFFLSGTSQIALSYLCNRRNLTDFFVKAKKIIEYLDDFASAMCFVNPSNPGNL